MAKYVLIPDSFKGTLSSEDICRIASEEILRLEPEAEICAIPVADGGEGTVDAFLAAVGGTRAEVPCTGPCGQEVMGFYGLLPDGTAVVEMAAAAGLPLAGACRDPEKTTTYGVGQLMAHALSRGAKRLVLGLGGSATNDGGCGAAAALGAEFLDEEGRAFVPTGGTLTQIAHIRMEGLRETLAGAEVTVMCDIDNPLCGPTGAAVVQPAASGPVRRHFSADSCAWALMWCWISRTLTGNAAAHRWSSPARVIWTARACGGRRWWAWPAAPGRWVYRRRRWWAAARRRWTRCTRRACPACSPSIRRCAPGPKPPRGPRRTCASPWATCCALWPPCGDNKKAPSRVPFFLEQGTGVEPALTAWEAAVIPIYQPCERCYYSRSAGVLQPKILSRA